MNAFEGSIAWAQRERSLGNSVCFGIVPHGLHAAVGIIKYCPQFPDRFGSIEDGRAFCQSFFRWYNHDHRHSGLGFLEPAVVHFGQAAAVRAHREVVLAAAYRTHPERFVNGPPRPADLPTAVWINPLLKQPARQDAPGTPIVLVDDQRVASIHERTDDAGLVMIDRNATLITG